VKATLPTIDLTDAEHAAVTTLIRHAIEQDRFPRARASTRRAPRSLSSIRR
jgi:hypothetical protein